ncbi:7983_t:CDS:10 [Entrophospora sp. SA101]|nr:7983_t:CDS:10 [Entrophospora sp. SA101]
MVNAQQEIERRFPKNVNGIYLVNVNLEGDLDLSEYTNLSETVDIGSNMPRLRSIKIPPFSQITWMTHNNCQTEKNQLQNQINSLNNTNSQQNQQINTLNSEKTTLTNQVSQLQQEKQSLSTQLEQAKKDKTTAEQERDKLKAEHANCQKEKEQLAQQIKDKDQELTKLNQQLQDHQTCQTEIAKLNQQITQLQQEKQDLQQQFDEIIAELTGANQGGEMEAQQVQQPLSKREEILGLHYIHPYRKNDESSYIVDGDEFIRENEGTGLVHLAPAFGAEDFNLAKKEKIISEISCPLEPSGYFNEKIKVSEFIGKHYTEVNDLIQVIEKKLYSIDEKTNYTVEKIDNLESTVFRGSSCVALKGTLSLKDGKKKKSIDFICYSHSSIVDPYLSPNALENYFPQTDIKFKQKTFFTWQKILFVFLSLGTVLFLFRTYKDIQAHPEHSAGRVIKGKNAIQKEIAKEQQQKDKKKREAEQRREAKITSPDEIVHGFESIEHVILYGPPGTGKTFLAQSIAKDSGSFFLNLNGADFETSLAEAFGNKEGPSSGNPKTIVALIDEIDRMGGGLDSSQGMASFLGILSALPDALLRQGRIGVKLLVNYPNKKELYEIITKVLKKFHIDNVKKTGGYEAFGNLEREAFANKFAKPVHEIMISNDFSVSYKDLMENYLPAGVDPNDRRTLFTGADVEAILYRLELRNEFTEEDWRQFSEQQMGDEVLSPFRPMAIYKFGQKHGLWLDISFPDFFKDFWEKVVVASGSIDSNKDIKYLGNDKKEEALIKDFMKLKKERRKEREKGTDKHSELDSLLGSPFLSFSNELLQCLKEDLISELIIISSTHATGSKMSSNEKYKRKRFSETFGKLPNCRIEILKIKKFFDFDIFIDDNALIISQTQKTQPADKTFVLPDYKMSRHVQAPNIYHIKNTVSDITDRDFALKKNRERKTVNITKKEYNLIIGRHCLVKNPNYLLGAVKEAISYEANALMIYLGAPQNSFRQPLNVLKIPEFKQILKENNIDISNVIVHGSYLINLANTIKKDTFNFSVKFLQEEIQRMQKIGLKTLILHPGSYLTATEEEGLTQIAQGLNLVLTENSEIKIALETMSGKDTCHLYSAGYDIKNNLEQAIEEFDRVIGLEKL